MKVLMSLGIVITLSLIGGSGEAKAAGCEAIGNVRFICDQLGPEDLAAVPGSDWVLSSGMAANGAIRLINLRDKSTTVLFPSAASREQPNKKTYESCPGRSALKATSSERTAYICALDRTRSIPSTSFIMAAGNR